MVMTRTSQRTNDIVRILTVEAEGQPAGDVLNGTVRAGTTVRFDNSDGMPCRFYSVSAGRMFVLRPEPAKPVAVSFDRPGVTEVRCAEHGRMVAYVVVKETPYFAVTDERGWYQIPDVPPGRHAVQAWYEGTVIATKAVELRTGTTTLDFNASRPERKAGTHAFWRRPE